MRGKPGAKFSPKIFPGAKFNMLTVVRRLPKQDGRYRILCRCDCGGESTPASDSLLSGRSKSCGCLKRAAGAKNAAARLTPDRGYGSVVPGAVFIRLTVIRRILCGGRSKTECRCSCGVLTTVDTDGLVSGNIKSCGCLHRDLCIRRNKETAKYGGFSAKFPRTWLRWACMIGRCTKPSDTAYPDYGGKGVKVCAFLRERPQNLVKTIGLCRKQLPSLDRYPIHNGHYSCGQCDECRRNGWALNLRWTTRKGQSLNRGDFNVHITAFGRTQTKSQWMEETGLGWSCITGRLRRGWSPERALTTPDKQGNCYKEDTKFSLPI